MKREHIAWIVLAVGLLLYAAVLWLIFHADQSHATETQAQQIEDRFSGPQYDPKYHGADMLVIDPSDGSMVASSYDESKKAFNIMWKRKGS